jgi:hypothetical protein
MTVASESLPSGESGAEENEQARRQVDSHIARRRQLRIKGASNRGASPTTRSIFRRARSKPLRTSKAAEREIHTSLNGFEAGGEEGEPAVDEFFQDVPEDKGTDVPTGGASKGQRTLEPLVSFGASFGQGARSPSKLFTTDGEAEEAENATGTIVESPVRDQHDAAAGSLTPQTSATPSRATTSALYGTEPVDRDDYAGAEFEASRRTTLSVSHEAEDAIGENSGRRDRLVTKARMAKVRRSHVGRLCTDPTTAATDSVKGKNCHKKYSSVFGSLVEPEVHFFLTRSFVFQFTYIQSRTAGHVQSRHTDREPTGVRVYLPPALLIWL